MVEVRLHGPLAKEFGKVWHFDIRSPLEAVRALECARPGFQKAIRRLDEMGMVFRIRTKDHDYNNDDVDTSLGGSARVDIIPIVRGASAELRFVIGAILVVAGVFLEGITAGQSTFLITTGVSMMVGSVAEMLTPKVKKSDDSAERAQSWTINGPMNNVEQGLPVPILYGEVLTGAYPISAGLSVSQVAPDKSVSPFVSIGGQTNIASTTDATIGMITVVVRLSAAGVNFNEPYTYTWTYTGFTQASARRLVVSNKATMQLELDYPSAAFDTGNVSIVMTGKSPADSADVTGVTASTPVTVSVETVVYNSN